MKLKKDVHLLIIELLKNIELNRCTFVLVSQVDTNSLNFRQTRYLSKLVLLVALPSADSSILI